MQSRTNSRNDTRSCPQTINPWNNKKSEPANTPRKQKYPGCNRRACNKVAWKYREMISRTATGESKHKTCSRFFKLYWIRFSACGLKFACWGRPRENGNGLMVKMAESRVSSLYLLPCASLCTLYIFINDSYHKLALSEKNRTRSKI